MAISARPIGRPTVTFREYELRDLRSKVRYGFDPICSGLELKLDFLDRTVHLFIGYEVLC